MAKQRGMSYVPWHLLAGIILGSLVLVIYFLIRPGPGAQYVVAVNLMSILYPFALGLLCVKGMRPILFSSRVKSTRRFTPLLLAIVLWVFMISQIAWFVSLWPNHQPSGYPAPQHFIALLMYPFMISAILVLPSRGLSGLSRLRLLLDSLLIMAAFATLCYYFIVAPILVMGHGTLSEKIVGSIFLQVDLVVIFCLLLVTLRGGETVLRPVLVMFALMILGLFTEHLLHLSEILHTNYEPLSSADAFLFLSAIMMTVAAQTVRRILERGETEPAAPSESAEQAGLLYPFALLKAILPSALVLLFGVLIIWVWLTGGDRHFRGQILIVYAGGLVVLMLMVLRQFLASHEVNLLQKTLWARNRSLRLLNKQLEQQVISDPLTGLPNHQALAGYLEATLRRAREERTLCSLLFIDIDHFKPINDEHGHQAGDRVLRQVGELVESTLRSTDYLGRWGGEEFVAVLPGTGTRNAYAVAERVRLRMEQQHFSADGEYLHLTCSVGVATYPTDASDQETLLMLADAAMYAAKRLGRNQTRRAREPGVLVLGMAAEAPSEPKEREVLDMVEALVTLQEVRDHPTGQHERRVASLALRLARTLGLPDNEAYMVSLGGLLHDLGKAALPDKLLHKREHLSAEEQAALCAHPVTGAQVLSTVPSLREVAAIVRAHHEQMDGLGYPDQLQGEAIPLGARIVAVADAYDVLTRRQALTPGEALRVLRQNAGSQFDPRVVSALERLLATSSSQQIRHVA